MTEISTTAGPSTVKKPQTVAKESARRNQGMISQLTSTAYLKKQFVFPSITKSASMLNLRTYSQQGGQQGGTQKRKIDMAKIDQLALAKASQSTQVIDFKKDKGELAAEINERRDDAAKFINKLYQQEEAGTINEYVTSIETLPIVKEKIEQFKIALQQKIKDYNDLNFQRKNYEQQMQALQKQMSVLEIKTQVQEDAPVRIEKLQEEITETQDRLDMELLHTEQLNHMIERDKLIMLFMKQPISDKQDDIEKVLNSILSVKALKGSMLKQISKYERLNKVTNNVASDKKKITDDLKEIFLQEISSQACFDEVYKNQLKIIEDREKELRQKKQEEQNLKIQEQQEKIIAEEKKRSETNKKNAKFQEEFLKISEECNVKKISDLVSYQSDQMDQKRYLKMIAESDQSQTEIKQKRLKELQEELLRLKYEVNEKQGDLVSEQEGKIQKRHVQQKDIDQLKDEMEKKKEEKIKRKKKMKETIATAIMSIARIANQLKEDSKITPQNADLKLSVCGLRLEHMVATLYKKKPIFNIESVNTDYSSDLPPFFLGIRNNIYVNPPIIEENNENELERFYKLSQNKQTTQDEENDFVNEEYMKYKKVTKALQNQTGAPGQPLIISVPDNGFSDQQNGANALGQQIGKFLKDKLNNKLKQDNIENENQSKKTTAGFEGVIALLNKGKKLNSNSQQVVLMTEKDREIMETKSQVQKQLFKIIHRTWYIFDPDKKSRAKNTFKPIRSASKSKAE